MAEPWEIAIAVVSALGLGAIAPKTVDAWNRRRDSSIKARLAKEDRAELAATNDVRTIADVIAAHGETKAQLAGAMQSNKDLAARNDDLSSRVQLAEMMIERLHKQHAEQLAGERKTQARELAQAMRWVLEEAERGKRK